MRLLSPTWSPDIDIHAVIFNLALRRCGSNGGDSQVSGVQVLLRPLAVVRLVVHLQYSLLVKLLKQWTDSRRLSNWKLLIMNDKITKKHLNFISQQVKKLLLLFLISQLIKLHIKKISWICICEKFLLIFFFFNPYNLRFCVILPCPYPKALCVRGLVFPPFVVRVIHE